MRSSDQEVNQRCRESRESSFLERPGSGDHERRDDQGEHEQHLKTHRWCSTITHLRRRCSIIVRLILAAPAQFNRLSASSMALIDIRLVALVHSSRFAIAGPRSKHRYPAPATRRVAGKFESRKAKASRKAGLPILCQVRQNSPTLRTRDQVGSYDLSVTSADDPVKESAEQRLVKVSCASPRHIGSPYVGSGAGRPPESKRPLLVPTGKAHSGLLKSNCMSAPFRPTIS